jgi:agmatinase
MTRICFLSFILILAASPAAVAQYYEYDPDDPEQQAPLREGEKALIPLDTADPAYNLWQTPRDDLSKGREPGPIDIQRFVGGAGWFGIPTFFRLPVALTPGDLMAGDVDVAIVGGYTDMGGGGRGAAWGPMAFRASPSTVGWGAFAMDHMLTLVNPFEEMTVVDYGDAPIDPLSTERTMPAIREFIRQIAAVRNHDGERVIPVIIGGDHSLMYPDAAGLAGFPLPHYGRGGETGLGTYHGGHHP